MRSPANEQYLFDAARSLPLEMNMAEVTGMIQALPTASGSSIFTSRFFLNTVIGATLGGSLILGLLAWWPTDSASTQVDHIEQMPVIDPEPMAVMWPVDSDTVEITATARVEISKTVGGKNVKLSQEISASTVTDSEHAKNPLPTEAVTKMVAATDAEIERVMPVNQWSYDAYEEPEWEEEEEEEEGLFDEEDENEEEEENLFDEEEEEDEEDCDCPEDEEAELDCPVCEHCNQAYVEDEDDVSFTLYCLRPGSVALRKGNLNKLKRKLIKLAQKHEHISYEWAGIDIHYTADTISIDGMVLDGETASTYGQLLLDFDVKPADNRRVLLGPRQIWVGDIVDGKFTGSATGTHADARFIDDDMMITPADEGGIEINVK